MQDLGISRRRTQGRRNARDKHTVIGGGQPLAADVRAALTPQFGHDFANVRIHSDAAGYSQGQALTTNLPCPVHGAIGAGGWIPEWTAAKAAGQEVKAGAAHDMVAGAVEGIDPALLSPAAKETLQWKLFDEMFRHLELTWDDVILPAK
jgi:hypothetical protein